MRNTTPKFALFGNTYQPEKSLSLIKVIDSLQSTKSVISIEKEFLDFIRQTQLPEFKPDEIIKDNDFSADYAISLGGDGTFLKTAEFVRNKGIPIIGINTGHLGFLADVAPSEVEQLIVGLNKGEYTIEKRSVLKVSANKRLLKIYAFGLNEVAVLKHDNSSMISIRAYIDNNYLNTYQSDGLIISTPTGSTGYSLSVGGPIIMPTSHSFAMSAVAAHSLNVRPIVINDDSTIRLSISSRNHNFLVSVDGRSQSLPEDIELTIRKAPYYIYIVKKYGHEYFDTLRNKLMWGADKRL